MISKLLANLFGEMYLYRSYERSALQAVGAMLQPACNELLSRQILHFNKVQRHSNGKEVNLYRVRWGKVEFDNSLLFENPQTELLLATVSLQKDGRKGAVKCKIWVVEGQLFSLTFSQSPEEFFGSKRVSQSQIRVLNVKIWADPCVTSLEETLPFDPEKLGGSLARWRSRGIAMEFKNPVVGVDAVEIARKFDCRFPEEYLEMLRATDGVRFHDASILGVHEIKEIVCDSINYVCIAELGELGRICVRANDDSGQIYYLEHDSEPHAIKGSLLDYMLSPTAK